MTGKKASSSSPSEFASVAANKQAAASKADANQIVAKKKLPVPATRTLEVNNKNHQTTSDSINNYNNEEAKIVISQNVAKPRKRKAKALAKQIDDTLRDETKITDYVNKESQNCDDKVVQSCNIEELAEFDVKQLVPIKVESKLFDKEPKMSDIKSLSDESIINDKANKQVNEQNISLESEFVKPESVPNNNQIINDEGDCKSSLTNGQIDNSQHIDSLKFHNNSVSKINTTNNNKQVELIVKSSTNGFIKSNLSEKTTMKSYEYVEDIDAGIELDGSSNSGSSVRDTNDEQMSKLASVSPVRSPTDSSSSDTDGLKLSSKKKQLLAANLNDIDADEKQLQIKLLKQQNSQLDGSDSQHQHQIEISQCPVKQPVTQRATKIQKKITKQTSIDNSVETSMCKLCNTHVYQMERILAEKSLYHKNCFRCYQCKVQLRMNNYASHDGQVYCRAHHRYIIQPPVKVDNENDVEIVAKSNESQIDDYLLQRGRLSEFSFEFSSQNMNGTRKKQMIICENEPEELPKDVVRCNDKQEDSISQIKVNLGNIKEKFEMASQEQSSTSSTPSVIVDKPSFNVKKTLLAFETKLNDSISNTISHHSRAGEPTRATIKKIANEFMTHDLEIKSNQQSNTVKSAPVPIQRSEILLMKLRKYESRIAGNSFEDDDDEENDGKNDDQDSNELDAEYCGLSERKYSLQCKNLNIEYSDFGNNSINNDTKINGNAKLIRSSSIVDPVISNPKLFVNLSSLKKQWENGTICRRQASVESEDEESDANSINQQEEELKHLRQSLALKKKGNSSIKNIYENAIENAKKDRDESRRDSNSMLQGIGKNTFKSHRDEFLQRQDLRTNQFDRETRPEPSTNLRTNKLKERFELGLAYDANNYDESDDDEGCREMSKMEKIRQEKLEDLSVFTEGEIKAREARSLFQRIDKSLTSSSTCIPALRSLL